MPLLEEIVGFVAGIFQNAGTQSITALALFGVVIYFIYKGVKLGIHLAIAAFAGAAFPLIANRFLGLNVPMTLENVMFYAVSATALLLIGTFVKKVLKIFK